MSNTTSKQVVPRRSIQLRSTFAASSGHALLFACLRDRWGFREAEHTSKTVARKDQYQSQYVVLSANQKQSIRHECICENRPPYPTTGTLASIEYLTEYNGHYDTHKLVPGIGNEIEDL